MARPARHLVLAAAVDHGVACGAALEVRRVRLLGAAAVQRTGAQTRRVHAARHRGYVSVLHHRLYSDARFYLARLQYAAALQLLAGVRKQLHHAHIQSARDRGGRTAHANGFA